MLNYFEILLCYDKIYLKYILKGLKMERVRKAIEGGLNLEVFEGIKPPTWKQVEFVLESNNLILQHTKKHHD